MSEFPPTSDMYTEPNPTPPPTPPVIRDTTTVRHFRTGSPEGFLPQLNRDLGLALTPEVFQRLQTHFKSTALRDPTVGELRLLDTLAGPTAPSPARIAVGELTTSSPAVAETWADMMAKHGELHGASRIFRSEKAPTPPCTLADALTLTGRYLGRVEGRSNDDVLLLTSPRREASAAAQGYAPFARIRVGGRVSSLWKRRIPTPEETAARAGDVILYLPRLKISQVQALMEEASKRSRPALGAIRAVAEKSLLATLIELCPAADLYVSRLTEGKSDPGRIPVDRLCAEPAVSSDGICNYLVRVSVKQVQAVNQILDGMKIPSVVCGQVRNGGNMVFFVRDGDNTRDVHAATLPIELMGSFGDMRLYAMRTEATRLPAPKAYSPALTRLPSVNPEESGITPDGRETVALNRNEGNILQIPDGSALMAALSVDITHPHTAYSAAAETTAATAKLMEERSVLCDKIRLSVSLQVSEEAILTDGTALGAICGIYCAAAGLALSVDEPSFEIVSSEVPLRLTVTALAIDKSLDGVASGRPQRQWHPVSPDASASAHSYLLPVLRRSYENSLKALSSALSCDCGAPCVIRPLAMNVSRDEDTDQPIYTLHPDSQSKLSEQLIGENSREIIPIFSMNEGDTRILLSQPAVLEAIQRRLETGGTILVLGESCKAFAEHGFLPSALLDTHTLPAIGQSATVTYGFPAEPATRLLRTDPLAASDSEESATARHLLDIHLADGTVIPDGFIGWDGQVLGLLNGVDTAILPYIRGQILHF